MNLLDLSLAHPSQFLTISDDIDVAVCRDASRILLCVRIDEMSGVNGASGVNSAQAERNSVNAQGRNRVLLSSCANDERDERDVGNDLGERQPYILSMMT